MHLTTEDIERKIFVSINKDGIATLISMSQGYQPNKEGLHIIILEDAKKTLLHSRMSYLDAIKRQIKKFGFTPEVLEI